MKLFEHHSLHRQLSIMLLAPLLALFIISAISILQVWSERQKLVQTQGLTDLAAAASAVLHELQNEAGLSVGFVASHGEHFRHHLRSQRLEVDNAVRALQGSYRTLERDGNFQSRNLIPVEIVMSAIERLPLELRYPVDHLSLAPTTVLSAFSAMHEQLIDLVEMLSRVGGETALLSQDLLALASFTKSKERSATERALLLMAFLNDGLRYDEVRVLNGLIPEQDAYTDSFLTLADASARERFAGMLASPVFDRAFEYRSTALEQTKSREAQPAPLTWWHDKTAKLDRLRKFEEQLLANVSLAATQQFRLLHQQLLWICALNLLVAIACCLCGRVVRCTVVRRLGADPRELSEVTCRIANYDFETDFAAYRCQSGSVMHDIQTMQRLLLEKHADSIQRPEALAHSPSYPAKFQSHVHPPYELKRNK